VTLCTLLGSEEKTNSRKDVGGCISLQGEKRNSKLRESLGSLILASERSFLVDFNILEKRPLGDERM